MKLKNASDFYEKWSLFTKFDADFEKFDDVIQDISDLPQINFLNIDCEGHDYKVISSIDLNKYSPELICIETHEVNMDTREVNNKQTHLYNNITELLKKNHYKILKRCGPSTIFSK